MIPRFLWVCLAGALGTGTRYAVGLWATQRFSSAFPIATLIVNLVGCFLIAVVVQASLMMSTVVTPNLRVVLTTGFMGGLTTYSAFNFETTGMWLSGNRRWALLNFGLTSIGCVVAGLLGLWITRRVLG